MSRPPCPECGAISADPRPTCGSCGHPLDLPGGASHGSTPSPRGASAAGWSLLVVAVVAVSILALNHLLVGETVARAIAADPRNAALDLSARYGAYVQPRVLVLDLTATDPVAPVDVWRGLFQSAAALFEAGRTFDRVELHHDGAAVYWLSGEDFRWIGAAYTARENPLYLIRTLPAKLQRPDGTTAYAARSGGLFAVGAQIEDANEAARAWAFGLDPAPGTAGGTWP